jgi:hypothetical protein
MKFCRRCSQSSAIRRKEPIPIVRNRFEGALPDVVCALQCRRGSGAMTWREPDRDVAVARQRAIELITSAEGLHCVWPGKRLRQERVDVDHCFPWAIWQCGDLWNLMPADRRLIQDRKRDRLVSEGLLLDARVRIIEWWGACLPCRRRPPPACPIPVRGSRQSSGGFFRGTVHGRRIFGDAFPAPPAPP